MNRYGRVLAIVTGTRHAPATGSHIATIRGILRELNYGQAGPHLLMHGAHRRGVDNIADRYAASCGYQPIPIPADWTGPCRPTCRHGARRRIPGGNLTMCPAAGPYRNQDMIDRAVKYVASSGADWRIVCCAFPAANRASAGTTDCMHRAEAAGILVISTPLIIG